MLRNSYLIPDYTHGKRFDPCYKCFKDKTASRLAKKYYKLRGRYMADLAYMSVLVGNPSPLLSANKDMTNVVKHWGEEVGILER